MSIRIIDKDKVEQAKRQAHRDFVHVIQQAERAQRLRDEAQSRRVVDQGRSYDQALREAERWWEQDEHNDKEAPCGASDEVW